MFSIKIFDLSNSLILLKLFKNKTKQTSTISDFFSSEQFNQTVFYLMRYSTTGQSLAQELSVFSEFDGFTDLTEITQIAQNALHLLDLIQKYDKQILLYRYIKHTKRIFFFVLIYFVVTIETNLNDMNFFLFKALNKSSKTFRLSFAA